MFSREQPSKKYSDLVSLYRGMHETNPDIYIGKSLIRHMPEIRRLAHQTESRTLLDYGSGKGLLYRDGTVESQLGVDSIRCYDPAVPEHNAFPSGEKFDGVISTDALEHIPSDDMPWVLDEMFSAARKFVFATVGAYPAQKTLPNGENAHASQNRWTWWASLIRAVSGNYPAVLYRFVVANQIHTIRFLPFRRTVHVITNEQGPGSKSSPANVD